MSRKAFDYAGISMIEVSGPLDLLERIADNMEGELRNGRKPNCTIHLNQSESPVEIKKDKRFDYLKVEKFGTVEQPSIKYTRYDTHFRTIHQKSHNEYEVDMNVTMDESSGLICIRNHLSTHPRIARYPLIHASLVNSGGQGVLITGVSRQGKTALTVYLLQERGAIFVSDENVILDNSEENIRGLYVPRTPRVRFSTIAESRLSKVLEDIKIANATQYIDPDAIARIIEARNFKTDAGIAFSRKTFCDLLGTTSDESSPIDVVLFPNYKDSRSLNVKKLGFEEGIQRLSRAGLMRKYDIDPKELQEATVSFELHKFEGTDFVEVEFSDLESLRRGGFRI